MLLKTAKEEEQQKQQKQQQQKQNKAGTWVQQHQSTIVMQFRSPSFNERERKKDKVTLIAKVSCTTTTTTTTSLSADSINEHTASAASEQLRTFTLNEH